MRTSVSWGALALLLTTGCTDTSTADDRDRAPSTPTPSASDTQEPDTPAPPPCPFSEPGDGDQCAGELPAGVSTTSAFVPRLTFSLPEAGWNNLDDVPYNYELIPPGPEYGDISEGTQDAIQVETGAYALNRRCASDRQVSRPHPGVGHDARAIAAELSHRPGVVGSDPRPVTVGSLEGYLIDTHIDPAWSTACGFSEGRPTVPMVGTDHGFIHVLQAGFAMRYYFLDGPDGLLTIEIQDAYPRDVAGYDAVVETFRFG